MFKSKLIASAGALALLAGAAAHAQDNGALLDLLVKKKVISDQEAEEVRADLVKEYAATSAGKIALSNSITEMKISGDIRMRFQTENNDYEISPAVANPASSVVAGTLPQWQGNRSPIFLPDNTKGTWYRDAKGNFHELQPGHKVYEGTNGKVYVLKATDKQPDHTSAANLYDRESGQHSFFFPNSSGNYYQAANGSFVKIHPGDPIPKGATRFAQYSNQTKPNHGGQQDRWRFRLRLRDEFKLAGGWFGGVELSTASAADSGNQTFGLKDSTGIGGGGFDKYGIFISKAYLGWGNEWATITAGKQSNPFYTTDLVWDSDINPDGLVEQINFSKMYFGGSESGLSKDGKTVVSSSVHEERPWELALNMGQFIFSDNFENGLYLTEPGFSSPSAVHHDWSNDAYLFEFQLAGSYKFPNKVKATFAPAFMFFNSARVVGANNSTAFTDIGTVTYLDRQTRFLGETRDLKILTAPGDVSFKIGSLPVKLFWDFAYNLEGKKRDEDIYGMFYYNSANRVTSYHRTQDDIAWLAGVQLGENKKAGDWSLMANYRQTGMAAVDPNLNDSDFASGKLNTQGFKISGIYNFTDYATGALTYMWAQPLRDNLVGGQATQGANLSNLNNDQILQVDVQIKF